jgi:hypothetical protein
MSAASGAFLSSVPKPARDTPLNGRDTQSHAVVENARSVTGGDSDSVMADAVPHPPLLHETAKAVRGRSASGRFTAPLLGFLVIALPILIALAAMSTIPFVAALRKVAKKT